MELNIIGSRLCALRNGLGISQLKLAKNFEISQSALHRYEHNQAEAPHKILLQYANFFDVSLDYIFGRTEHPEGMLYEFKPKIDDSDDMKLFIEMCFDPKSPMSTKLKNTLLQMMKDENN